jgi:hypothetical protein
MCIFRLAFPLFLMQASGGASPTGKESGARLVGLDIPFRIPGAIRPRRVQLVPLRRELHLAGPIWLPTNYSLVHALEKYHRFLGPDFRVPAPCKGGQPLNLAEIATLSAERLVDLDRAPKRRTAAGLGAGRPAARRCPLARLLSFHKYFHGATGEGLGAAHQTGWPGCSPTW